MAEMKCKGCGFRYAFKGEQIPTAVKCICESKEFEKL
jgi:hypothetical protein